MTAAKRTLIAVALIWTAGTVLAISSAELSPGACRAPYRAWAATWPVWILLPASAQDWAQIQAWRLCNP